MPDIQKAFARKQAKGDTLKSSSGKRKSSEFKEGREISSPNAGRKRKLDQIQHVPTLVSSTFNPLEEVDFPRGGSALTPLEKKEAENEGIRDALFETAAEEDTPRKVKARKGKGKEYDMEALLKYNGPRIEGLSFKRLVEGTLVLGQVSQINPQDIAIALPNNLAGYVSLTRISPPLTKAIESLMKDDDEGSDDESDLPALSELFSVGQWVRAVVTENTEIATSSEASKKKHIELSLEPEFVNSSILVEDILPNTLLQVSVSSIEDHGIIVSPGLSNLTGFIKKSSLGSYSIDMIKEGQVYLACVEHQPKNNVIQLSLNLKSTQKPIADVSDIASLLPGDTVQCLVSELRAAGAGGKILGMLDATIDQLHIGGASVTENKNITARITAIFPSADPRRATLSLLPHIVALDVAKTTTGQPPLEALPVGYLVEAAKVVEVIENQGVYVDIGVDGVRGFVHISRLSDQRIDQLLSNSGPFKVSSLHRGRITGYNPVDNLFLLSFEQRILDQPFLRIEDVQVGSKLEGTIEKVIDRGVIVRLAEGITGWIPVEQSADVLPGTSKKNTGKELISWEKRFKEGTKIKCEVLNVDLTRRRILLTTKKTLLNSTLPPLTSYSPSIVGQSFHGTIVSLTAHGAIVEFYSGVRGYLPVSEMSEAFITNATEHFRQGQTVKTWVLSVDESEKRMRLSLKDQTYWSQGGQSAFENLAEGNIVAGTVSAKLIDKIVLDILSSGVKLRGVISVDHLADTPGAKCEKKLAKIREGSKLKEVLVLSKNPRSRIINCSLKPALIVAASEGNLPLKYENLYRGRKVTGWVKNIEDFGGFIGFAGSVEGVVYKKDMADEPVTDPHTILEKGQIVTATVVNVDAQLRRSQLSLRTHLDVVGTITAEGQTEAIQPLDQTIKFIEDYTPGRLTLAKVLAVKQTQANVALAENLQGRIDVSEVVDSVSSDDEIPLKNLKKGSVVRVRILGFHDAKTHRYLPLTHRTSNTQTTLELSCKPSHIESNPLPTQTLNDIKVGERYPAYINKFAGDYLWLNISPTIRGRMHILNLTSRVEKLHSLSTSYPIGSGLSVIVLGKTEDGKYLNFSSGKNTIRSIKDVTVGSILPGRVSKVLESGIMVQLSEEVFGKVGLTDISDTFTATMTEGYHENAIVRVCVLDVDTSNDRIALSMRASRTLSSSAKQTDRDISSFSNIKSGEIIRGFVTNIADSGLFVSLARNIVGRVLIRDLSDQFLKDWKSHFKVNQLVKGRVLSVDAGAKKVGLSLKPSVVEHKAGGKGFEEIIKGDRMTGVVTRVETYGIFIRLDGFTVSGMCHKSEISDTPVEDFQKLYDEGDKVKVLVLNIDQERKRVSLGLKASYFESDDEEMDDVQLEGVDEAGDIIETDSEPPEEDAMHIDSFAVTPTESQSTPLAVEAFSWTGETILDQEHQLPPESESDYDSDDEKERLAKKKHKRSEIKYDKTLSLPLSSAADYERTLLSQPDSSLVWTQYMAHLLQLGEIDKARSVAERALKIINIREEGEKLNIWVAFLNMENSFGTDETLEEVFRRACEYADKKKMHSHLVSILIKSGKNDKVDEVFETMIKKFSQSSKVWVNYAAYLMEHNRADEGRELLPRSLKILPKRKHVKTVSKFAQMEFKLSSPEHGRTIMTGLLANYPRRFDLWSVFLDLEIKQDEPGVIRRLFQRVLATKMSTKKAKFFFKKWLQWEAESGDANGVEDVKRRAKEYVEGLATD